MSQHRYIKVDAPFPMPDIAVPCFPELEFNIKEYGASQDNQTATSSAIAKAIKACHEAGGGRVLVPEGVWPTGPIHFKSFVELHLKPGATLLFSGDPQDYLPPVEVSWASVECMNFSPLIYAYNCTDIAVTGKGILKAKMKTWTEWFKHTEGKLAALKELYHDLCHQTPVNQRDMTKTDARLRPHFIHFNRCSHILLEDFTIDNSPFWTVHTYVCDEVLVQGISVKAKGHNNDGIDPEMTRNMLIQHCSFDQGDDAIVIKAGRNQDGWRVAKASENIVVRYCQVLDGHQFIAIGTELSAGVRNVYVHDCDFPLNPESQLQHLLSIKTNERRGGFVENIYLKRLKAGNLSRALLALDTDVMYVWRELVETYEKRHTKIGHIYLEDIEALSSKTSIRVIPNQDEVIHHVHLKNVRVNQVLERPIYLDQVQDYCEEQVEWGFVQDAPLMIDTGHRD